MIQVSCIQQCPDLSCYDFKGHPIELGLSGIHQRTNASLALQLCKTWIEERKQEVNLKCQYIRF